VRKLEEKSITRQTEEKSIRQIRIRHSDRGSDDFLLHWIKVYELYGSVRDLNHSDFLAQVFIDTGANCNTISGTFFRQLIDCI